MKKFIQENSIYMAFAIALAAMLGSLYFSEILHLPPCVLCWYQRIAMYPLVVIFAIGILLKDLRLHFYAIPLALAGLAVSIYHNLLYYKIIPEALAPCIQGVSCTTKQIEWFGFITIPLLSLIAFVIINILLVIWATRRTE